MPFGRPGRKKEIAQARQVAVYVAKHLLGWNYSKLSRHIAGGRDRTTVIYSLKTVDRHLKDGNPVITAAVNEIGQAAAADLGLEWNR